MSFARLSPIWPARLSGVAVALLCLNAGAQSPERPVREAFVVETDGTAEKRLSAVGEYVAQERWDAAISLLREVAVAKPEAVVRVSPRRSMSLPLYCDVLLTRLPRAGLERYRAGVDPQAAAWLAEAELLNDARPLRSIAERMFVSSQGDEAIHRLAERAWERGEFDLARRYWTALVPLGPMPEGQASPAALRYPDATVDLAAVRARLVLCSVALGERGRAARELDSFRRLHPGATGRLAGKEGSLADSLGDVIAAATNTSSGDARGGWDVLPATPATGTLGQTAGRGGVLPFEPAVGPPRWIRALPTSRYVTDDGRPALPDLGPLAYSPVIWRDKVFVADDENVFGFELADGRAAWAVGEEDPGVLYPAAPDLDLDPTVSGRPFAANPLVGMPRHTLTVQGDRLYARLGSPITSPAARELRRYGSQIVCLDLAREGLMTWSVSSESLGGEEDWWAFEGPPVAEGNRLYVLATRSRPQAQLNAVCLDAATGGVIWNRSVGAPITSPPEGADVMTHRLVTAAAGRLYVQTDAGAIVCLDAATGRPVWVGWYESVPRPSGAAGTLPERNLPAAPLFSGGVLVAAPNDSGLLFAYDAESGAELWSREVRGGREPVGVRDGVLVVSGERLTGFDLFTGRELWVTGFEDSAGFGAGRGLLAGRYAYWPTREDLFVVEVETGEVARRVPLADVYGLAGGGNLAAWRGGVVMGRADGVVMIGER